jgi:hypothetical protein
MWTGDWICTAVGCNVHNFQRNRACFRCGADKSDDAGAPPGVVTIVSFVSRKRNHRLTL